MAGSDLEKSLVDRRAPGRPDAPGVYGPGGPGFDRRSEGRADRRAPGRDAGNYRNPLFSGAVKAIDVVVLFCVAAMSGVVQSEVFPAESARGPFAVDLLGVLVFAFCPKRDACLWIPGFFSVHAQMRYLVPPMLLSSVVVSAAFFLLRVSTMHAALLALIWVEGLVAAMFLARALVVLLVGRRRVRERLLHRLVVIGSGSEARAVLDLFSARVGGSVGGSGYRVLGMYDDGPEAAGDVRGGIDAFIRASAETAPHSVIIALPPESLSPDGLRDLVWRMRGVHADIFAMPYLVHGVDALAPAFVFGGVPLSVLQRRPLGEVQMLVKTAFDLVVGFVALLCLLPIIVPAALAVKLTSPGPVLFRQPRQGLGNGFFTVYKFRSMYVDQTDVMSARQTSRGDPRVTPVGRWLRRLSIDELPQIFNVLRLEMSLVGPRPHAPHTRAGGMLLDDAIAEYVIRHQVRPGITGWAQVNGSRGEIVTVEDLGRRVQLDLEYIRRWSVWLDLRIIWLTVVREIFSRGAF